MEIFKKPEKFVPRQLPLKRVKEQESKRVKGGGKWIFALFAGSIILSLGLWAYGNLKTGTGFQKIISPQIIPTPTPTPIPKKTTEVIDKVKDLVKNLKGAYGVYVFNLTTKQSYGVLENEVFPAASLIKLPVFLTLYQEAEAGRIDLETKYTLKNSDKQTGAGGMQYKPAGTVYTYRQVAELTGKQSDNTAFFVLRKILGDEKIQKTINDLGMTKTSLSKNETTPQDLGLFFRKLYAGSVVGREHRDEILSFLTETFDESRIPVGVPEGTRVAHKIGTDIGVISDAGIVFAQKPFILVILSKDALEKETLETLPEITMIVWEFESK